jgi:hypothetical protein
MAELARLPYIHMTGNSEWGHLEHLLWLCSFVCLYTPETAPHSAGHCRSSSRATALGSTAGPLGHVQATLGAWVDPSCFRSLAMVGTAARIKA